METSEFMPLQFFSYGEPFTGSIGSLSYRVEMEKGEEKQLKATLWQGPLCYGKTPDDQKETRFFPFSEEGRLAAIEYIQTKQT